ncbi:hypothetical protein CAEBREN_21218 [Caenorhabditis brenneri]|uniref:Uncharacterized protein n=1 Tax=Caenorhabditis brenneri TaxID=135651 RepID=G0PE84_CAEBE|nr:hypothetical protein CAEBREN_21218 [Caenorhabditis brenneri]
MDAREKNAAAQIVRKVKYELWKVIDRLNEKCYAKILLKDAEEVCEHFVKKLVNMQMKKLKNWQKHFPDGDVFQSFGRALMFKELLNIDAKSIDQCRYDMIQEADLMIESMMAEVLLHYPSSDMLIWRKRYWMFTRKSRLFLLCALCVDPPERSPLVEIQQFFIALTETLNRKMREEMRHLPNPYFLQTEGLYFAKSKSTFQSKNYSYHRLNENETDSLLLNEKDYCSIRVYEKYNSEKESAESYEFRCYLYKELLQKSQKAFENASRKDPWIKELLTEPIYLGKKMNCKVASSNVSPYSNTVNVPVEKERIVKVEKVESSQTFDCVEAKNEKEEEQVYQQCVRKIHVLDEIKRFDFKAFYKKNKITKIFTELFEKDCKGENEFIEESPDMNSLHKDPMSANLHSIQLTPCQKEVTVHSSKGEKLSGIPTVRMKPDPPLPLQKPGLQKPEDVACGGFSGRKTKRRFREEPRPRTDPPQDSVNIYGYEIESVRSNLSRHDSCNDLSDSSNTGDLSEKYSRTFTRSIRPLKDPPAQVASCDKMKQPVFKSDHDFYWRDTSSKLIMKDSYQCTDTPDPWNLMTTYWRGAQEEYRPRKDPPTLLQHQHLPWLDHHGSTLVMAHG